MDLPEQIDYLTINKQVYSSHKGEMEDVCIELYSREGAQFYLPPTIGYTPNPMNCEKLSEIPKTLGLKLEPIPEEVKDKFKENMAIQEHVLDYVARRDKEYNYRCGLIKMTTGQGKSHVIMDIVNHYQTDTLILVHNIKTLGEMYEKFKKFTNYTPGRYGGGKKEILSVTIMTKSSFVKVYDDLPKTFNVIIKDECHIGFSEKMIHAINKYCHGKKGMGLYALSGTPKAIKIDPQDFERYFGKTIEKEGQDNNGYNFIPEFTMVDYHCSQRYKFQNPAELRTAVSENMDRLHEQIKFIKDFSQDRKCILIMSERVADVENFLSVGNLPNSFMMTGATKEKDDNENIENALRIVENGGQVYIIANIKKVGTGVDIPFIDTVFLISAVRFESTVIQAVGRGLRKFKGKEDVKVCIWNDLPHYKSQRDEKRKAIRNEYGITTADIKKIKIGNEKRQIKIKM